MSALVASSPPSSKPSMNLVGSVQGKQGVELFLNRGMPEYFELCYLVTHDTDAHPPAKGSGREVSLS